MGLSRLAVPAPAGKVAVSAGWHLAHSTERCLPVSGKAPPSCEKRVELQRGKLLSVPHSRPMPAVGPRCHELRVVDEGVTWRIIYRIDPDAIVIAEVFAKKTAQTPAAVLEACRKRLKEYDDA
jgi:hypothetical protein